MTAEDVLVRPSREIVLDDLDPKDQARAAKLSRPALNALLNALWARRKLDDLHKRMTAHHLLDLVRRNEESADVDGYGTGGSQEGRSADPTSTTESAALRNAEDGGMPDPIGDKIAEVLATLAEAAGHARRIVGLDDHLDRLKDPRVHSGAAGAGDCLVCGRYCAGGEDRLVSGLCRRHYDARRQATGSTPGLTNADWLTVASAAWAVEQAAAQERLHEHEAQAS